MSPAKAAFVDTRQGGSRLHELIGCAPIMSMFVVSASAAELVFHPSAEFDGGVPFWRALARLEVTIALGALVDDEMRWWYLFGMG